jgi:hypothetical protein
MYYTSIIGCQASHHAVKSAFDRPIDAALPIGRGVALSRQQADADWLRKEVGQD